MTLERTHFCYPFVGYFGHGSCISDLRKHRQSSRKPLDFAAAVCSGRNFSTGSSRTTGHLFIKARETPKAQHRLPCLHRWAGLTYYLLPCYYFMCDWR